VEANQVWKRSVGKVKYQLDQIIGDGLIDEVLVPKCIAFRTDY